METSHTVWLVTDQLPFPPRNGITVTVANYVEGLRQRHDVRLILLVDADDPPDAAAVAENERRIGPIRQYAFRRKPPLARVLDEWLGRDIYYHGWQCLSTLDGWCAASSAVLIVSPMSAVAKWRMLHGVAKRTARVAIAAVNDCTTLQYHARGRPRIGGFRAFVRGWMDRCRSVRIARIERALLEGYDHILLQTQTDKEMMRWLVGEATADRVTLAPNGIRPTLASLQPDRKSNQVTFVAELRGEYAPVAYWLVSRVWPYVLRHHPATTLRVIGKGGDVRLRKRMEALPGVSYSPFVDDMGDVYRTSQVVVSPVFKGYGLITKTLEAMASGVPVVGGSSAFNGIEGFVPDRDGIVCETPDAGRFAQAIASLLKDPVRCQKMGESGRSLVRDRFRWETTLHTVEALLDRDPTIART